MVTIFSISKKKKKPSKNKQTKKQYCGLLGGLTFYRTCHICKCEKKNTKMNIFPLSCTGHVHKYVQKDPFCGLYSSLQLHNLFLVHAMEEFLFLVSSGGGLY